MYAEVVINLSNRKLDKLFHYAVPPSLRNKVQAGSQVIVPFGPRVVDGYVVGFSEYTGSAEVKELLDVAEEEPLFNIKMLELARWMANNYLCSLVEGLHAVMPPGLKLNSKKKVYINLTQAPLKQEEGKAFLLEKEGFRALLEYISAKGRKAPLKELEKKFGVKEVNRCVAFLNKYGVGGIETYFSASVREKTHREVSLNQEYEEDFEELIDKLTTKASKQAEIIQLLLEEGKVTTTDLTALGYSSSALKALTQKNIVLTYKVEDKRDPFAGESPPIYEKPELTNTQKACLANIHKALIAGAAEFFLLHGVTGSGKTEVYLQAIEEVIKKGRQAIYLIPEIALTPQTVERFRGRFGDDVAILHSALSLGERYDQWRQIKEGKVRVVVGARSAVFAPVPDLGLLIIDEEHEATYKQEVSPKYHAREVAFFRARQANCPVILGSATPSMESYRLAREGRLKLEEMPARIAQRPMPRVDIVDLRKEMEQGNRSIFSGAMIDGIKSALEKKEQVIIFLNRRGFSTFVVCRDCGFVVRCRHCSISMTYHASGEKMVCHYCGYRETSPTLCPVCKSRHIRYFGLGTQRVESELNKFFPEARVIRMDVDTTGRKGAHQRILQEFAEGRADILVGTQMIAKGLDFPKVTFVGVVTADTSLNLPDFRSAEKTFQLLTQVAGRAGRAELAGRVVVQSYEPEHYSIKAALDHDYKGFYRKEENIRRELDYPPFCQLARIVISGFDENKVIRAAHLLAEQFQSGVRGFDLKVSEPILGPAPAPLSKLKQRFRWQLCLKARSRKTLVSLIEKLFLETKLKLQFKDLKFSVEIDPQNLL